MTSRTHACAMARFVAPIVGLMVIAAGAAVSAGPVYNRQNDFNAATNIDDGDNTHGGLGDPSGSRWSYYFLTKADRTAHGQDPDYWQPIIAESATRYRKRETCPTNGGTAVDLRADSDLLHNFWDRPSGQCSGHPMEYPDLIATFTVPQTSQYSISGSMQWYLRTWEPGGGRVIIGTVDALNNFTELFNQSLYSSDKTMPPTDVPNFAGHPALRDLWVNAGDEIAFVLRGHSSQYRRVYLDDSGVNIALVPEPASVLLLGGAVLALWRRRRNHA